MTNIHYKTKYDNWFKVRINTNTFWDGMDERLEWRKNIKDEDWYCYNGTYYFRNESDAIVFRLKFNL